MCDWSNEFTLKFLELYQNEPVIWDPMHLYHKDRKQINDAWVQLSGQLECPVTELKKKKDSLMATFRGHLRKKKASIRSGAGVNDIYKPIWFAYEYMESFLSPVYECQSTINTQDTEEVLQKSPKQDKVDGDSDFPRPSEQQSTSKQKLANQRNTTENEETKRAKLLDMECKTLQSSKSDSQIIASGWGIELSKMTPNQQLYAKKFIDDILFEGRLGNLHRHSVSINHSPSPLSP